MQDIETAHHYPPGTLPQEPKGGKAYIHAGARQFVQFVYSSSFTLKTLQY